MNQEFINQESEYPEQGAIPGKGRKKLYEIKIDKANRLIYPTGLIFTCGMDIHLEML